MTEAKTRVQALLKERGYTCQEDEKAFDLIERYMLEAGLAISISEETHKQQDKVIADLRSNIVELQKEVSHLTHTGTPTKGSAEVNQHMLELLKESASGFSDHFHYRSYCLRVSQLTTSIEGVQIAT